MRNSYNEVYPLILKFLVENKLLSSPQIIVLLKAHNIIISKTVLLRMISQMKKVGLITTSTYCLPSRTVIVKITNAGINQYENIYKTKASLRPLKGFPSNKTVDHYLHIGKFFCMLYPHILTLDYTWISNPSDNMLLYQVGEKSKYRKSNRLTSDARFRINNRNFIVEIDLLSENKTAISNKFIDYFSFLRYQYATERTLSPIIFAIDVPAKEKQSIDAQVDTLFKNRNNLHSNEAIVLNDTIPSNNTSDIRKAVIWREYIFPRIKKCIQTIIELSFDTNYEYVSDWLNGGLRIYVNSFEGCIDPIVHYEVVSALPYYAFALGKFALPLIYDINEDINFNIRPTLTLSHGYDFSPDMHAYFSTDKKFECLEDYQGVFIEDLSTGNVCAYWRILQYIIHLNDNEFLQIPELYKFAIIVNGIEEKEFLESLVHNHTKYDINKDRFFFINRADAENIASLFFVKDAVNKKNLNFYSSMWDDCYALFRAAIYN